MLQFKTALIENVTTDNHKWSTKSNSAHGEVVVGVGLFARCLSGGNAG